MHATAHFNSQFGMLFIAIDFYRSGEQIEVFLNMSAQNLPNVISRNTVDEIKGSQYPDEVSVCKIQYLSYWCQ